MLSQGFSLSECAPTESDRIIVFTTDALCVVTHAPNIRMTSFADDATENQNTDAGSPSDMKRHPNIIASPMTADGEVGGGVEDGSDEKSHKVKSINI